MDAPTLVILAAGLSARYGSLKQVDPLGPHGESIMDYNVFDAARAGFAKVVFVVRPEIEEAVRNHAATVVGDAFPSGFATQSLDRVPVGFRPPLERTKPWGTTQAILCASEHVRGPFGVCNADDLYGADAFAQLHEYLTREPLPTEAAMVGYTLADTLSESGSVARGICVLKRDRLLDRVTEIREIRRVDGWITGEDLSREPVELRGNEIVSMNLWGFHDPVVRLLERQFRRFLERWGGDTSAELPLSTALSEQVQIGTTRVAVLQGRSDWFGVNHAADREAARAVLRQRVAAGLYPQDLGAGFREGVASARPASR